jgi:hypothetical protein
MSRLFSNTPAAAVVLAAAALACAEPSSPNLESTKSVASSVNAPLLEEQHSGTTQRLQARPP